MAAPTLEGYTDFLRNNVGIPLTALPVDSPYIEQTYKIALELVLTCLKQMPDTYTWAVYNLATHMLVCQCPDQDGQTYFKDLRTKFGTLNFTPGLIQESHDETTGQSWMVPDIFKKLNVRELAYLKTPWGQAYMGIAQMGFPLYGIS